MTTEPQDLHRWIALFRVAAACLILTVLLIPVQLSVFLAWPLREMESAGDWFSLLQEHRFVGLVALDLLLVVDWILLLPVYLVFFVTLRRLRASWVLLAVGLWFVAFAGFLASNASIEMAALSARHARSLSEDERASLLAAGEALLARWQGTAFHVGYLLGQLSGVIMGAVMLRSSLYSRAEAWLLLVGNAVGFGYYLPRVGLEVSALSGVVLWAWYGFAALTFVRLGWGRHPVAPLERA